MKKLLYIFISAFIAINAFAWDPHNSAQQEFGMATSNSKKGLWITAVKDMSFSYTMNVIDSSVTNYGYYILDSNLKVVDTHALSTQGGTIENISADTNIGFWYEDAKGKVFSSVNPKGNGWSFRGRETTSSGDRWFYFEHAKDKIAGIMFGNPVAAKIAGQPLPGLLLTLALFGVPVFGYRFFKKKSC